MPKKTKQKTGNPFYKGASPEEVARALLRRPPKDADARKDKKGEMDRRGIEPRRT